MQRVKAHELRTKNEKDLVDELTKFRVSFLPALIVPLERIGSTQS